jgi:hypothetical protein
MTWNSLGSVSLNRKWDSFLLSQGERNLYRFVPDPNIDWVTFDKCGGGWLYYRFRLLDPQLAPAISGVSLSRRFWLDPNPRVIDFSGYSAFPDRVPEAFFFPRRRLFLEPFPLWVELQQWEQEESESNLVTPEIDEFVYDLLTVPSGKGTSPAARSSFDPDLHFSGAFTNTSPQTVWIYLVSVGSPAPSRTKVVESGIRLNQNGGTFSLPPNCKAEIYLATSSAASVSVSSVFYLI